MRTPSRRRALAARAVIAREPDDAFVYEYDFGDGWVHDLQLEKLHPNTPCEIARGIGEARACPPED